ncbi:MAG TPA: FAD/NAD(P)-binding protein, partial [Kamptonema sp.]|nr:FAD/NAD(P)-binding protein [Kamptonema sp.]
MSENSSPSAIAIIGGGFSGVMVAVHLLKLAQNPLEIKLIERQPLMGRGRAYSGDSASYLLNVPAGKMSAFADRPDHFLNWLKTQPQLTHNLAGGVKAETFIPRHIYGKYIEAILETAAIASQCGHLERICDEAISIRPDTEGATIYLSSDRTLQAQKVVLALGNFLPSDPPVADPSFYNSPRYIRDARSDAALAELSPDDSILLVGSGLTAVDIAIALRDSNHKGKIHAVSRRGLLSQAHKLAPPASVFLSPDTAPKNIRSLLKLIRQEVRAANS